jgi:predicted DsbA family dithiol-disulfide isomerase
MKKPTDRKHSILVAHDYQCAWSYVALFQAKRLAEEFPRIIQEWWGFELLPNTHAEPKLRPAASERLLQFAKSEKVPLPSPLPPIVNSHKALLGAEYVSQEHFELFQTYNELVYRAMWEEEKDISNLKTLGEIAEKAKIPSADFLEAITGTSYENKVYPFPMEASARGIAHVTSFRFHGEQCAEAPYETIREMAERFMIHYIH